MAVPNPEDKNADNFFKGNINIIKNAMGKQIHHGKKCNSRLDDKAFNVSTTKNLMNLFFRNKV